MRRQRYGEYELTQGASDPRIAGVSHGFGAKPGDKGSLLVEAKLDSGFGSDETNMGLLLRDHDRHTYGEYLSWPDDVRYELVDGRAYLRYPAPGLVHQDVAGELYRQVANQLAGKPCRAFIAPVDVRFPQAGQGNDDVDTVLQPDVFVVCDESKLDRQGVCGAPDWVVEVLSPTTASHDQIRKRRIYERSGVPEFWLIHPLDRVLTIYRLVGGEYGKPEIQELEGSTEIATLTGVS